MDSIFLPVRHMQQRHSGECLAACALMVLDYAGISIRYQQLLRLLVIKSGIGAPSSNVLKLASLGVNILYKQGNMQILRQHLLLKQPCIAFVDTSELPYWNQDTDHAVVVVGMDDDMVYLNDPHLDIAPVQTSIGDFDLAWLARDEMYAVIES
ncbi:MAG: peptidase C39 family protein [Caldilineaceae bacterium]|nr:peptidase C39 family protein [Caldilineaceae bacterium]